MRRGAGLWGSAAVALVIVSACDNGPPTIIEAGVVSDTSVEQGPYEVRALAYDVDGIGTANIAWTVALPTPSSSTFPSFGQGSAKLAAKGNDATGGVDATRLEGFIDGQPLGSVVSWTLVVCDVGGACTSAPGDGGAFVFHVGPEPSSPLATSLDPDHGPQSGGTRVELHGSDFRPEAKVRFGAIEASSVEFLREDLVAAITDASDVLGVVDVVITNPDGRSSTLPHSFTFTSAPSVTGVNPGSGPEAGGTQVVITGTDFVDGDRAFFAGVACRDVRVVSPTEIDCTVPPGHAGKVDVSVRAGDGGRGTDRDAFEYIAAPVVDGVDPSEGSSDGGDVVSIVGSGFAPDATATIGGTECVVTIVSEDGTEITCTTPPGTPGAADVVVTNPDGQSDTLPGGFGFLGPPVIVEVVPPEVPFAGNVPVRVLGAGLDPGDTITFGGASGTAVTSPDTTELDVIVPPAPVAISPAPPAGFIAVDVVATRHQPNDTRTGTLAGGLIYFWPPEVDAVSPSSGPTTGGTAVTITGRFFNAVTASDGTPQPIVVTIGGAACVDVTRVSSTTITCTTPPGAPGPADVVVKNESDSTGTLPGGFFYIAPPLVTSIDPPEGPTFGGDVVTVHGQFFQPGALVFIEGSPCSGVTFIDADTLTCTTPPGSEGTADVGVTNPDAQQGTAPGIYRYLGVAVTPDHGLPVGFTKVSVRSAAMHADAIIAFDGVIASCSFVSSREFTCQSPPHAKGDVDVTFANGDGTTETGHGAFHYRTYVEHTDDFPFDGSNVNDVDMIDLDGDGDLDVVVATGNIFFDGFQDQSVPQPSAVYENDGHGKFTRHEINVVSIANSSSVADINNDGKPDILFGCTNGTGPVLLENDGDFHFHQVDLGLGAFDDAFDAEFVDVVGDGRKDIYNLSAGCDPNDPIGGGANCDPTIIGPDNLLETTNAGFTDRSSLVPHDSRWVHDHKMVAADLDGDGANDIVIVTNNTTFPSEQNRVLMNRVAEGQGFVTTIMPDLLNVFGDLYDIEAGDVDGDGAPDIVTTVCTADGSAFGEVLLHNDSGTLTNVSSTALPSRTVSCTVGSALVDLDDDGDLDLIYGGTVSFVDTHTQMRVFINKGDGTFVDASAAVPAFSHDHVQINNFAVGDIDGDRDADILIAGGAPYNEPNRQGHVVVLHLE